MSLEVNKALVRRFVEEVLGCGDFAALAELPACTCVDHAASASRPSGLVGIAALMTAWRAAFPDLAIAIEELVAEGDMVANRFTTRAKHDGPLFGIPPTNNRFTVRGMEFHRVRDGKVAESWISDDLPGILVQLGLVRLPSPG